MAKHAKKGTARRAKGGTVRRGAKRKAAAVTSKNLFEHLRLKVVRLLDVQSHLEIHDKKIPDNVKIEMGTAVGPSPNSELLVDATLKLEGRPKNGGEGTSVLTVHVHYQCVYEVIKGKIDDFIDHSQTIAVVGTLTVWPYIRELAQSITARMAIPPVTIPMFVPQGAGDAIVSLSEGPKAKKR